MPRCQRCGHPPDCHKVIKGYTWCPEFTEDCPCHPMAWATENEFHLNATKAQKIKAGEIIAKGFMAAMEKGLHYYG